MPLPAPPEKERFFRHARPGSPLGRIAEAGYTQHGAGGGVRPWRVYGRYALVYLFDGAGHYADTRGVTRRLLPGDLIVVRPDLGHAYGAGSSGCWREYYLAFDGAVFDLWARSGLLLDAARPVRHLEPVDAWLRRFAGIVSSAPDGADPALHEVCLLQALLADILRADGASTDGAGALAPGDARGTARARALLEAGPGESGPCIESVARQLGLTPGGFRKRFARLAGQPPARYRLTRRIDQACERLSRGASVKETAAAVGFCDEFHFSRRFKQITGESPGGFRRRMRSAEGSGGEPARRA